VARELLLELAALARIGRGLDLRRNATATPSSGSAPDWPKARRARGRRGRSARAGDAEDSRTITDAHGTLDCMTAKIAAVPCGSSRRARVGSDQEAGCRRARRSAGGSVAQLDEPAQLCAPCAVIAPA
jgi:hypothetical protein